MANVGHITTSATTTYFGHNLIDGRTVFIDGHTVYILMKNNKITI